MTPPSPTDAEPRAEANSRAKRPRASASSGKRATATKRAARWSEADVRRVALAPAGLLAAALIALVVGLGIGGGAAPLAVADPGVVVMWGVPVLKLLGNIAAALTVGSLVAAMWIVSRQKPEFERTMAIAQGAGAAWFVIQLGTAFFQFLQISNVQISVSPQFGEQLLFFFGELELGHLLVLQLVMLLLLSTALFAVRAPWGIAILTGLSLLTLWPQAAQGHAAGAANHELAFGGMTLHITGAAVWLGGLLVISLLARSLPDDRRLAIVERYSTLALLSFIAVTFSSVVIAFVNVGSFAGLLQPYGIIVLLKTGALVVLGVFGVFQRRGLIERMRRGGGNRPLAWLIALELAIMGIASGLAAALGRTPSVVPQIPAEQLDVTTPAMILAGRPHPPEFDVTKLFTVWSLDPIWTLLAVLALVFYFTGVYRLRKRGDAWPISRSVSIVVAMAVLLYLVNGPLYVYGRFMFSFHMTEHMILTMLIPVFIVMASPIMLLLRTVRPRHDGSMGTREWVLRFLHSRWAHFISHPIVAAVLFGGSLLIFYYTPLFRWALTDHVGHMWMIVDFTLVGYLFAQSLIGDDPGIPRARYPLRLIVLVLVMTFHAFFGISIMSGTGLLVADWFGATGRDWGPDALTDQQLGGAIAWGIGELPTVLLALLVTLHWVRDDTKEQKRRDRRIARDGNVDRELEAYNARLAQLAEQDAKREAARKREEST